MAPTVVPKKAETTVRWLCGSHYARAAKSAALLPSNYSSSSGITSAMATRIKMESRYYCQTTTSKGNIQKNIKDSYQELQDKCPGLVAILTAVTSPRKRHLAPPRVLAAASLLLQSRNSRCNAFQKLIGLLLWKGQLKSLMFRRLHLFGLVTARSTTLKVIDTLCKGYDAKTKMWKDRLELQENMQAPLSGMVRGEVTCGDEDEDDEDWVDMEVEDSDSVSVSDSDGLTVEHPHGGHGYSAHGLESGQHTDQAYVEDSDSVSVSDSDGLTVEHPHGEHGYSAHGLESGQHTDHAYGLIYEDGDDAVQPDVTPVVDDQNDESDGSIMEEGGEEEVEADEDEDISDVEQRSPRVIFDINYNGVSPALHPSFQFVIDNLNYREKVRHKLSTTSNVQHNMMQAYSVLDRVNCEHLPNDRPILDDIRRLPQETWWLDDIDQSSLKQELQVLIGRIGVVYIPCMKVLEPAVIHHITHQHQQESMVKSDVNKLGILEKDEMNLGDMIDTMCTLQRYCPVTDDGTIHKLPFGGDGLTVQRGYSAQKACADGFCPEDRLKGLIPKPEDWHEGVIILQDVFTKFYNPRSLREKGTLSHLRELFDRRGVKASVKDAVNDDREFLQFVTHGLVVLALMQVLRIDTIEGSPSDLPSEKDTLEVKQKYLDTVCSAVVDTFVFPQGVLPSFTHPKPDDVGDYVFNYECSLLREGLLDIARIDAVKEGDGERIVLHWRYDFVHFHCYNHSNYRTISFRLISQIFGSLTHRMAARMIFNRTVNVHGGIGHNISLDIFLEFLNKDSKNDLKRSGPNLSKKLIERIGQSKQVLDELLHTFDRDVELFTGIGRHKKPDWSGEIKTFVSELHSESLFTVNASGRKFKTFPKFPLNKIHNMDFRKLEEWVAVQLAYLHSQN